MLSENQYSQSSASASRAGQHTRPGESAGACGAREGAAAHREAIQSENGSSDGPDFSAAFSHPGPDGAVGLKLLRESLNTSDPIQSARVTHAVQMAQAMDRMQRRQKPLVAAAQVEEPIAIVGIGCRYP